MPSGLLSLCLRCYSCSSAPCGSAMDHAVRGDAEGRSRKLRDTGWQMQGPLAGMGGIGVITTPSPVVPLKFEQPPGQWQGKYACTSKRIKATTPFLLSWILNFIALASKYVSSIS